MTLFKNVVAEYVASEVELTPKTTSLVGAFLAECRYRTIYYIVGPLDSKS